MAPAQGVLPPRQAAPDIAQSTGSPRRPGDLIRYEHPLNERVRTWMRLEDLFRRARHFVHAEGPYEHHAALMAIFEIADVVGARADLKSDLLQEIERQRQALGAWRNNPQVSSEALDSLLGELERASADLLAHTGKAGQHLRDNEWLMSIKQRAGIPGGVCEFDLPSYHHWLHRDPASRQRDLMGWLEPMGTVDHAVGLLLRMLRESARTTRHVAIEGMFQQMLSAAKIAQLVRLSLAKDLPCVPEVSANKYALSIRFLVLGGAERSRLFPGDVEFDLTFCSL